MKNSKILLNRLLNLDIGLGRSILSLDGFPQNVRIHFKYNLMFHGRMKNKLSAQLLICNSEPDQNRKRPVQNGIYPIVDPANLSYFKLSHEYTYRLLSDLVVTL